MIVNAHVHDIVIPLAKTRNKKLLLNGGLLSITE